jgi:glucose-1-phosphate thymidylyltransferase
MSLKGIILAGGSGTRLHPMTKVMSKHLLPIYDKPMIFYPLSTLMLSGIKDILIISTPEDTNRYEKLLGNGSEWGINLQYKVQDSPEGIAQAFIIGEDFIGLDPCMLILGDNLFFGTDLQTTLLNAISKLNGAYVFGYAVNDPERYGVVEFDDQYKVISIEEKPKVPKSKYAVSGLYLYDNNVVTIAKNIKPSERGELEISTINNYYLENSNIDLEIFGRGMTWLDTGTADSLMEAGEFVKVIQKRQGFVISCPEEISWRNGWIDSDQIKNLAQNYGKSLYKEYLLSIIE